MINFWNMQYQSAHDLEENVRNVTSFVRSPVFDRHEKMYRDEGDDAIGARRTYEALKRTLDLRGLEAYIGEFAFVTNR